MEQATYLMDCLPVGYHAIREGEKLEAMEAPLSLSVNPGGGFMGSPLLAKHPLSMSDHNVISGDWPTSCVAFDLRCLTIRSLNWNLLTGCISRILIHQFEIFCWQHNYLFPATGSNRSINFKSKSFFWPIPDSNKIDSFFFWRNFLCFYSKMEQLKLHKNIFIIW